MAFTVPMVITLVMTGTAAVFSAALAMLMLWQDWRRRSNQLFTLTMLCFFANTSSNFLFRFNFLLNFPSDVVLHLTTTCYIATVTALFAFELHFARVPRERRRPLVLIGLILSILAIGALWRGLVQVHIELLPDNTIHYALTPLGYFLLTLLVVMPLLGIWTLSHTHNDRARTLWPVSLLLPIAAVLSIVPPLEAYPINATAILIIGLVTAQLIVREHVLRPMRELNRRLAATNAELARVTELKSQFLANMSHELRTPLNSVIGYTDLVTNGLYGPLTEKQLDRLEKVGRNGRQLLALINDVLDLSKIEAGHMKLAREPLRIGDNLTVTVDAFRAQAAAKGLTLTLGLAPDLPPVLADPMRLDQILTNLLSNAIQYTSVGGITVRAMPDRGAVRVSVADTGIGIAEERQAAIFEGFGASGQTLQTLSYERTGLGLTLTRHLVQMHGGRIWLTSDGLPGKGSTFFFTLPEATSALLPIKPRTGLLGPTLLCIDDSHEALEVLQGMLESEGYRVHGAQGGPEGIRKARELIPDAILLDVMMPGLDGWQVIEVLRGDPHTTGIPVIVVSGLDAGIPPESMGAAGYLTKPIQRADLLLALQAALANETQEA